MLLGIIAGLTTGALWGLTFIAPLAVAPYSPWDLTVVRYLVFALASLGLMVWPRFRPFAIAPHRLVIGLLLGGVGFIFYVAGIFFAVTRAGVAIPPLVVGLAPILLALVGNKFGDRVPWRALALPLALITAGLATVNGAALAQAPATDRLGLLAGLAFAFGSLLVWITYAFVNQQVMDARDAPDAVAWTGVQGIGAGLGSLALLPLTSFAGPSGLAALERPEAGAFLAWCVVMGLGGSWAATWCWVVASRRLPLALSAQLIVGETVFGLTYGFVYQARWPTLPEALGSLLQVGGVAAAIAIFHGRPARPRHADACSVPKADPAASARHL